MEAKVILIVLLLILTFDFLFNKILEFLNFRNLKPQLPKEVSDIYDQEKYAKSIAYSKTNTRLTFIVSSFSFVLSFSLILTGFFGWLDEYLRQFLSNEILITLTFFGTIMLGSDLLNIPFQLYDTFVVEEKFGFNKTTVKTYILDKLKMYLLSALIGGLIVFLLLKLIVLFDTTFWVYFWIAISIFTLFMNIFYSTLILPLFNKLKPLEDGELKSAIVEYSKKVDFPIENIFVIDGSKRSSKSNAYFMGLGKKKKIVLYDTLIENHTTEELVAVLAHEAGHYKKNHIITGYLLSTIQTGLTLYIMSLMIFNPSMSLALGGSQNAIHLNLLAFGILYTPISHFLGLFMNVISRNNEYAADAYAKNTFDGKALQAVLKKLSVDNLSNLLPHPAYVFFNYSHPPLLKRLEAIEEKGARSKEQG